MDNSHGRLFSIGFGDLTHTYNPTLRRQRQEDNKLNVNLFCIVSSRPTKIDLFSLNNTFNKMHKTQDSVHIV